MAPVNGGAQTANWEAPFERPVQSGKAILVFNSLTISIWRLHPPFWEFTPLLIFQEKIF